MPAVALNSNFLKNMEYQKYIEQIKRLISDLTKTQWTAIIIVALLIMGGAIYLINPSKKLLEMRNAQRRSDVVNILNLVHQYSIEKGTLPFAITATPKMICKSEAQSCEGLIDISEILKDEKILLKEVPIDPKMKDVNISGYQISKSSNGRINVIAPLAENNAVISLSK